MLPPVGEPKEKVQNMIGDLLAENGDLLGWHIKFNSEPKLLSTGNEPLRLFRELDKLGELTIEADTSNLPEFKEINPEQCYLNWYLSLKTEAKKEEIDQIFEWVIDDNEIEITPWMSESKNKPEPKDEPSTSATANQTAKATTPTNKPTKTESKDASIRVSIDKIDDLINIVGELVITQSMLSQVGHSEETKTSRLIEGLAQLEYNTRELQERVMKIRMLPISFAFNRFPRMVRDVSNSLNKKINLTISGEQTELDKILMEKIGDPLSTSFVTHSTMV
ncbi:hypothetical protein [Piscirickettsia litoralis]|uniref:hypothetical protein n=1 Tax=Piscirickettsia litoralis TaxID=1891921 RepID=UPI001F299C9E|nr:hypothetical protein [Piscirickettsia litoralis]